MLNEETCQIPL
ncbi:hypothetical protein D0N73_04455 [Pseudomonas fluorescens]|nr:hypothetical protein D0N73_04455 [Pseudomonas fluorescens]